MNKPEKETLTVEFKSDRKPYPLDDLYKEIVAMSSFDGSAEYASSSVVASSARIALIFCSVCSGNHS